MLCVKCIGKSGMPNFCNNVDASPRLISTLLLSALSDHCCKGALLGGTMLPAMVLAEPEAKGCVYLLQGVTAKGRQELGAYGFEESLDLALLMQSFALEW